VKSKEKLLNELKRPVNIAGLFYLQFIHHYNHFDQLIIRNGWGAGYVCDSLLTNKKP